MTCSGELRRLSFSPSLKMLLL